MNFFLKPKDNFYLVLDIGTEAVKCLIFFNSNKKRKREKEILGAGLEYYCESDPFDKGERGLKIIKETISNSLKAALKDLSFSSANKKIKKRVFKHKDWKIFLGLPPNIFKARISEQFFCRKKPKDKISSFEEKEIISQLLSQAKKDISGQFSTESGIMSKDIHWLTVKFLEKKIDGYSVEGFRGFKGKDLELRVLVTFAPRSYLDNLEKIINSLNFKILRTVHLAESLALIYEAKTTNNIFIDIGGTVSQIFTIKKGKIAKISEFMSGGSFLNKAIEEKFGLEEETARLIKERYSSGLLSEGTKQRIQEVFLKEIKNWYNELRKKMLMFEDKEFFSSDIFLFGGGALLEEIKEIFEEDEQREEYFSAGCSVRIDCFFPKDLNIFDEKIKNTTKILNNTQWTSAFLILKLI